MVGSVHNQRECALVQSACPSLQRR